MSGANSRNGDPRVEYPRGDIEIIPPDEQGAGRPFGGTTHQHSFGFEFRRGTGITTMALAAVLTGALFMFLASTLVLVAGVVAIGVVGYAMRNQVRRWFGI
jgi:hypothetical protein